MTDREVEVVIGRRLMSRLAAVLIFLMFAGCATLTPEQRYYCKPGTVAEAMALAGGDNCNATLNQDDIRRRTEEYRKGLEHDCPLGFERAPSGELRCRQP
jgi:hypothetical protein